MAIAGAGSGDFFVKIDVISFNIRLAIIFTLLFNIFPFTHKAHHYQLVHFVASCCSPHLGLLQPQHMV